MTFRRKVGCSKQLHGENNDALFGEQYVECSYNIDQHNETLNENRRVSDGQEKRQRVFKKSNLN